MPRYSAAFSRCPEHSERARRICSRLGPRLLQWGDGKSQDAAESGFGTEESMPGGIMLISLAALGVITTIRSTKFRISRTLPGQSYSWTSFSTISEKLFWILYFWQK